MARQTLLRFTKRRPSDYCGAPRVDTCASSQSRMMGTSSIATSWNQLLLGATRKFGPLSQRPRQRIVAKRTWSPRALMPRSIASAISSPRRAPHDGRARPLAGRRLTQTVTAVVPVYSSGKGRSTEFMMRRARSVGLQLAHVAPPPLIEEARRMAKGFHKIRRRLDKSTI